MMESKIIQFRGMPLFQKARFTPPYVMHGEMKEFACFFYMTEGHMLSYDVRGVHKISNKEAILKNCGNYVQEYLSDQKDDSCEAIAVYLYPNLLKEVYKDEIPSFLKEKAPETPKKLIANKLVEQYMTNLSIYFESPETLDEDLGILKIKELMMILLKSEGHQDIRKLLSELFAPINVKFKQAIDHNIRNNISLEQLAFICNMSLSAFKREFKKNFEDTPARYIKRKRLEYAASQILCGDDSITSVAFDSGFQDLTTFSASFQEKYGISPSKYRLSQTRN